MVNEIGVLSNIKEYADLASGLVGGSGGVIGNWEEVIWASFEGYGIVIVAGALATAGGFFWGLYKYWKSVREEI